MHGNATQTNSPEVGNEPEQIGYKVRRAAQLLDLHERTVWELVYREEREPGTGIESVKIGRARRIPRAALLAYMERLRSAA